MPRPHRGRSWPRSRCRVVRIVAGHGDIVALADGLRLAMNHARGGRRREPRARRGLRRHHAARDAPEISAADYRDLVEKYGDGLRPTPRSSQAAVIALRGSTWHRWHRRSPPCAPLADPTSVDSPARVVLRAGDSPVTVRVRLLDDDFTTLERSPRDPAARRAPSLRTTNDWALSAPGACRVGGLQRPDRQESQSPKELFDDVGVARHRLGRFLGRTREVDSLGEPGGELLVCFVDV